MEFDTMMNVSSKGNHEEQSVHIAPTDMNNSTQPVEPLIEDLWANIRARRGDTYDIHNHLIAHVKQGRSLLSSFYIPEREIKTSFLEWVKGTHSVTFFKSRANGGNAIPQLFLDVKKRQLREGLESLLPTGFRQSPESKAELDRFLDARSLDVNVWQWVEGYRTLKRDEQEAVNGTGRGRFENEAMIQRLRELTVAVTSPLNGVKVPESVRDLLKFLEMLHMGAVSPQLHTNTFMADFGAPDEIDLRLRGLSGVGAGDAPGAGAGDGYKRLLDGILEYKSECEVQVSRALDGEMLPISAVRRIHFRFQGNEERVVEVPLDLRPLKLQTRDQWLTALNFLKFSALQGFPLSPLENEVLTGITGLPEDTQHMLIALACRFNHEVMEGMKGAVRELGARV